MNKTLNIALCEGRHHIPQATDGAIFPTAVNPVDIDGIAAIVQEKLQGVDEVNLYVTGLTVALVEVIKYCYNNYIDLTLYHFNRDTGTYYPQIVNKVYGCPFCGGPLSNGGWCCPHCGAT